MYEKYAELRDSLHLSDYAVSKKTGVGRSTLSDWKTGKHVPNRDNLKKICDFLNVPMEYLMDEEIKKNPTFDKIQKAIIPVASLEDSIVSLLSQHSFDDVLMNILKIYYEFNEEGQKELLKYAELLKSSNKYIKNDESAMVQGE